MNDLKATVVAHARACGFDLVGIASAEDFVADRDAALERIREGRMEGLPWYTESRVNRGASPSQLLPGARSVISLGLSYWSEQDSNGRKEHCPGHDQTIDPGTLPEDQGSPEDGSSTAGLQETGNGRVARYAWVRDYHRAMKRRMRELVRCLQRELDSDVGARWYVDDGPMLDRAAANRAGIGWFGKNTNILTPGFGSWVFLGQVITDLSLAPDEPLKKSCGSCVRCIDDCPTGALVAPYVLDNARCISYLTIENRGAIPRELRPLMGDWVFGCDICQDVCPVNRKEQASGAPIPLAVAGEAREANGAAGKAAGLGFIHLVELLEMTDEDFLVRFAGTSLMRAKRVGMQRNACVALGNERRQEAVPALGRALTDGEPLVRAHAAWALGQIGGPVAAGALAEAAGRETDPNVLEEIAEARRG